MGDKMKRYLRIYAIFLVQYLKRLVNYRLDFIIGVIYFIFVQASGILFIALIFQSVPDLNGYSFDQMLFLYGFFQLPRGLDHLFTDNIWLIPMRIKKGDIDRYLVRPIPALFQLISERFQHEAMGEIITGIVVISIAANRLNLNVGMIEMMALLFLIILGAIIYSSLKLLTASISFWVTNSMQLMTSVYNLADFAKYPLPIFPKAIQILVTYFVPFAFVSYFPATVVLENAAVLPVLFGSSLATIILAFLALSLWRFGLRSYTSVGS